MAELFERYQRIVVEGPIGVGKTTLAKKIADRFEAQMVLEQPEMNPFLAKFYEDATRYALPTQLCFLFQRLNQLKDFAQQEMFFSRVVGDFLIEKDPLFAELTLGDDEWKLYQQIYQSLPMSTLQPDVVIYLQADPKILLDRIQRRGVMMESGITQAYLTKLCDAYTRFFYHYDKAPVMMINTENLDLIDNEQDFDLLLNQLVKMKGKRTFFGTQSL